MILNPKLIVVFYATKSGREPVREWLKKLSRDDKRRIGEDIKTVQFSWPVGLPLIKKIDKDLWEIRTDLDNRISRLIIIVAEGKIILLHGFIKKDRSIPQEDLKLARKRLLQVRGKHD